MMTIVCVRVFIMVWKVIKKVSLCDSFKKAKVNGTGYSMMTTNMWVCIYGRCSLLEIVGTQAHI